MTDEHAQDQTPAPSPETATAVITPPPAPPAAPSATGEQPKPPRKRGCGLFFAAALGVLVGAAIVAGVFVYVLGYPINPASTETPPEETIIETRAPSPIVSDDAGFAERVAAELTPAVVNIAIEQTGIDRFTGQRVTQVVGNGSGVIIRQDGYIITNNHVIEGADAIIVTVGVEDYPATVVGTDPSTDLAVIKVEKTGLPVAEIGSSANLAVGEPVVAIGSPFGLEKSVTTGIVSALGRSTVAQSSSGITAYTSLIQTDAAINPGNSGGALADANGRLIGINTLIQSNSGQSAGIGFAIPIDFARSVAEEIISTGRASHPFMGVGTATIGANEASRFNLPVDSGVLVESVTVDSPAERGGIRPGDIIVRLGDTEITSVEDLFKAIRAKKVGDTVDVAVVRGEERVTLKVTLASDTAVR